MENNKRILFNFILYVLTFMVMIVIGISNIFADEYLFDYNYQQIYYDNSGSSLSGVGQTWNESLQAYVSNSITTTANSYGAGVAFNSPIPIIANHTYTMSFYFLERSNIALSSKNHIAVGNSAYNAAISRYANSSYYATTQYSNVANGSILSFVFKPTTNAQWIFVPWTTTSTTNQTYVIQSVIMDDLGDSGVSQAEINTSLANQTNTINNYIQNSTNTITNNSNANRDAIINNQNANNEALIENDNANTDRIIEENNKNFNDCHLSINLFNKANVSAGYQTTATATTTGFKAQGIWYVEYPFNLSSGTYTINYHTKILNGSTTIQTGKFRFLYSDNTYSSYYSVPHTFNTDKAISKILFYTDSGSNYVDMEFNNVMIQEGSSSTEYEDYNTQICVNRLDQQTNAINGLNDNINDDNTDGATSEASDFFSDFNTNTFGLTSIITAPLNLIQSLTSTSCSPLHLPLPYLSNKYLDLPCMSTIYSQHFGTFFTLYQTITYGIIAYWVCVRIFNHVKDFKNPEHDEIEVVDL